ncbi:MAG: hypothetical protein RLZZ607_2658 [Pseudomonadota bacterium]|jgi:hypothetical protein
MSTPDSFVDEVTDAVRSDRLYAAFRKYGWIGIVVVLLIVGGAGYNEWQKAQTAARAERFGDALMAAAENTDPAARSAALAVVPADGDQKALLALLQASDPKTDKAAALAALDALVADTERPQIYRDLGLIKRVAIAGTDQPLAERRAALASVDVAGRPMRVLAAEQLAYLLLEEGKKDEALAALITLVQDQEAPAGQRQRLGMAITALGGTVPETKPAAVDAAPSQG